MQDETHEENTPKNNKKKWVTPEAKTDTNYETRALGCVQCRTGRPGTEVGWDAGNCLTGVDNY